MRHLLVLQRRENSTSALCKGTWCTHVQKNCLHVAVAKECLAGAGTEGSPSWTKDGSWTMDLRGWNIVEVTHTLFKGVF